MERFAVFPMPNAQPRASTPSQSLQEYGRGLLGGLLFSLPLLYTMEIWGRGLIFTPTRLLAGLAATYGLLLLYNRYAGLRADAHRAEVWIDSVEELGLGLALAAGLLALLGRLGGGGPALGLIVLAAMAVAIGVSVGTAQLGTAEATSQGQQGDERLGPTLGSDLSLSLCGAVLLALNIAPTDEIVVLAADASRAQLLGLAVLSLALCSLALFFSGFRRSRFRRRDGLGHLLRGLLDTYAVALLASAFLLWFFGRFDGVTPAVAAARLLVLGLPTALGASAGRLLLRPDFRDDDDAQTPTRQERP